MGNADHRKKVERVVKRVLLAEKEHKKIEKEKSIIAKIKDNEKTQTEEKKSRTENIQTEDYIQIEYRIAGSFNPLKMFKRFNR